MRTLILMRHAKAVKASEAPSDETRGLTGRGERDAAEPRGALAGFGLAPQLALVSSARRTRETAAIVLAMVGPLALGAIGRDYTGDGSLAVRILARNTPGVLASISTSIGEAGSNIERVAQPDANPETATLLFTLSVRDRDHMARVLKRLRRNSNVLRVNRIG